MNRIPEWFHAAPAPHLWRCRAHFLDDPFTFRVRHRLAQQKKIQGSPRENLGQPRNRVAPVDKELPVQNALPGEEEYVVMSITEQARTI
jgi:hypothetical protein